ncbi:MAG: hypothetical protein NTU54_02670 [Candidatus Omnitrophica bacterium]|nr:hypothetical protein [Candidatus Omnitrophota bacterium]
MKRKILYAGLGVLIIILLIRALIGREATKIQPAPEETPLPEMATEQQNPGQEYTPDEPYTKTAPRAAITIIKRPPNEETAFPPEEQIQKIAEPQSPPVESGKNAVTPRKNPAEPSRESAPGVTKIGKRPTKEENKEMNSRGIVMY